MMLVLLVACQPPTEPSEKSEPTIESGTVHFVALGDVGEGNAAQYQVAAAMEAVCSLRDCDFALLLGDNFYNDGVESVDDEQFQTKFELPYAGLDLPFYVALGNHDYGNNGYGSDQDQPDPQVEYTERSEKWILPDRYHRHDAAHASFFALDTNALMWSTVWSGYEVQAEWLQGGLGESKALWKIVYGHHPYLSNGPHGPAGAYEGFEGIPIVSGEDVQRFVEENVCGQADLYLAGHDHVLEWLEPECGTNFGVSGAGAKTSLFEDQGVPSRFGAETEGFLWVGVEDRRMEIAFYDKEATLLYTEVLQK